MNARCFMIVKDPSTRRVDTSSPMMSGRVVTGRDLPQASCRRTSAATRPPSARPVTWGVTTFITWPMARGPLAPVSAIAAATMGVSSASVNCAGK